MKKVLVIGSAVVDVIMQLEHLPAKGEDVHVLEQQMQLGGCAYNVSDMVRHFQVPYIPFFPVGSGAYGAFVRDEFNLRGICTPIPPVEQPNGCCYCFVEEDGERTFASWHGAEYLFQPEWFSLLKTEEISCVYICGLEIEEATGGHIVDFLEKHPDLPVYFAPGPRLGRIDPQLMDRIFALKPILHLNEEEACTYTGRADVETAAARLHELTGNAVLITRGRCGALVYRGGQAVQIPGVQARQVDTNGAGDAHIGAVIACVCRGMSLVEAVRCANRVSALVVQYHGATLSDTAFADVLQEM